MPGSLHTFQCEKMNGVTCKPHMGGCDGSTRLHPLRIPPDEHAAYGPGVIPHRLNAIRKYLLA